MIGQDEFEKLVTKIRSDATSQFGASMADVNKIISIARSNFEPRTTGNIDIHVEHGVQITIRKDGGYVWINVDGLCALRLVCGAIPANAIQIEDLRTEENRVRKAIKDGLMEARPAPTYDEGD